MTTVTVKGGDGPRNAFIQSGSGLRSTPGKTARGRTYRRTSLADRLWARTIVGLAVRSGLGPCWEWQGSTTPAGYGQINDVRKGRPVLTHRVAYEDRVGPIPPGFELDHLCDNKRCVRPAHLQPLTKSEHSKKNHNARKTHCKHGHPYVADNVRLSYRPNGYQRRQCLTCEAEQREAGS